LGETESYGSGCYAPRGTMRRILYMARHGETDWNAAGRWQGHTDVPLNDKGREQARALAEALRAHGIAAAASSDLSRARDTARIVAEVLGVGFAHADPDLRERRFGIFEGLTRHECETLHPGPWRDWVTAQRTPEGGETQKQLADRVVAGATRVVREVATDARGALIVTHGGSLRAFVHAVTGEMPQLVGNGDVWRVTYDGRFSDAEPL
jgi:broad specificity phosphatase PhoE